MRDATADQCRSRTSHRRSNVLLRAALARVALGTHGLRVRLGHVFSLFGLAIVAVAIAVVDLRGGVDPDEARAATGYCCGGGLRRRGRAGLCRRGWRRGWGGWPRWGGLGGSR